MRLVCMEAGITLWEIYANDQLKYIEMSLAQLPATHYISIFTFVPFVDSSQFFAPIFLGFPATTGS